MVDIEAEKNAIQEAVRIAFEAEDKKDLEKLLDFFADDVVGQAANSPQFQGKDALREFYKGYLPTIVSIKGEFSHVEVSSSGDMAWDVGYNRAETIGPEGNVKDQGKYFAVYKKVNGKWKCSAIASSSDLPLP